MARNEGLSINAAPFPREALPRGLKYELVARSPGGVIVIDEDGNGEMFFSHPPPYIFNQQPPVCEVRHAVINEPSIYRKRRGKPSREERERRRLQKAKDLAASAAAKKAAKELRKENAARAAEMNEAHRRTQISRRKAKKDKFLAAQEARAKTYSDAVKTSPPPASLAVPPKTAVKIGNKVTGQTTLSATVSTISSPESYVQTNVKLESTKPPIDAAKAGWGNYMYLGWQVKFIGLTDFPYLNGELGYVVGEDKSLRCTHVRVRVDSPQARSVMGCPVLFDCHIDKLLVLKKGDPHPRNPKAFKKDTKATTNALEKSLVELIATTRGPRSLS